MHWLLYVIAILCNIRSLLRSKSLVRKQLLCVFYGHANMQEKQAKLKHKQMLLFLIHLEQLAMPTLCLSCSVRVFQSKLFNFFLPRNVFRNQPSLDHLCILA